MSKKQSEQQPLRPKTPTRNPAKARTPSPVTGWRPILQKPKVVIKHGREAREAIREEAQRPLTFWSLMIRLLPAWALLIMILILEPMLPIRAVGAAFQWVRSLIPATPQQPPVEPVFIVEGTGGLPVEGELPPPGWSLELSPVFTPEVQYWADSIADWSVMYRIKPNLIATLMQIESCGDPTALSEAGAQGLFQVMPIHFAAGEDPFDPDTNARRALVFFAEMYAAAHGDIGLAFAAYNGGASVIEMSPADWPAETRYYQFWGSGIYEEAEQGLQESPTLLDWLNMGGEDLCIQAAGTLGIPREASPATP